MSNQNPLNSLRSAQIAIGALFQRYAVTWIFLSVVFAMFWPGLLGHRVLGFRDSMHFYYPLWDFIDVGTQTESTLFPMWNPLDGFGCSVVAEPTSMIFYPVRIIVVGITYLMSGFVQASSEQTFAAFIAAHLIIAYFTWYSVARSHQFTTTVSQSTAVMYALSGSVFFQIYNPPFLIGAAWLPVAMDGLLRITGFIDQPSHWLSGVNRFAVATALMILGGDAQCVYNCCIIALPLLLASAFVSTTSSIPARGNSIRRRLRDSVLRIAKLGLACTLSYLLASIQILPTQHWMQYSERLDNTELDTTKFTRTSDGENNFSYSSSAKQDSVQLSAEHRWDDFSIRPAEFLTLVLPVVFGNDLSPPSTWIKLQSNRRGPWSPSYFIATFGLVMAIGGWIYLPKNRVLVATAMIALASLAFSLGNLGPYPILAKLFPIYSQFRYPAKWSVFWNWAFLFTAAFTWNFAIQHNTHLAVPKLIRFSIRSFKLIAILGLIAILVNVLLSQVSSVFEYVSSQLVCYGTPSYTDFQTSVFYIGYSGLVAVVGTALLCALPWHRKNEATNFYGAWCSSLLLLSIMLQCTLVAGSLILWVPTELLRPTKMKIGSFESAEFREELSQRGIDKSWSIAGYQLPSILSGQSLIPRKLYRESSRSELQAQDQGNRSLGKLHLLSGIRSFNTFFTLTPRVMRLSTAANESEVKDNKVRNSLPHYWEHNYREHNYWEHTIKQSSRADFPRTESLSSDVALFKDAEFGREWMRFVVHSEKGFDVVMPVFDDRGWFAERDSFSREENAVSIEQPTDDLLTLHFPPGDQHVKVRYFTPGLWQGATRSWVGLLFIICSAISTKHLSSNTRSSIARNSDISS